ncbi:hypothetical protein BpHYR1_024560 [Brachionus plicatilis]|uniref:Uncharacterized protein n=1 Tax=Brachionus plicatilis TaxID=10195 RepID=A0A3M7SXI2_BRAPC|nr:hypothetical protein BpHYR1_024560 [Brachionus plicatilis]
MWFFKLCRIISKYLINKFLILKFCKKVLQLDLRQLEILQPNETQKISDLGIRSCEGSDSDLSRNDEAPPQKKNPNMKQISETDHQD